MKDSSLSQANRKLDGRRCRFLRAGMSLLVVCLTAYGIGVTQEPQNTTSFYGAIHPSIYLNVMAHCRSQWKAADKDLFVRRFFEAYLWVNKYRSDVELDPAKELPGIVKMFPELEGRPIEYYTVWLIGYSLGRTHPQIVKSVRLHKDPEARFHGFASPAELFDEVYSEAGRVFSPKEWGKVSSLLAEGSRWEKARPDIDFGLDPDGSFLRSVRRRYQKLKLKISATGVHVRDVYAAMKTR